MINKIFGVVLTLAISVSGLSIAQEANEDIFQSGQGAIVVTSSSSADGMSMGTNVMALDASELGDGPMVFASDMMDASFVGGSGDSFSMLNNPSVQKDLQLVDEQLNQIRQINKDFGKRISEKVNEMRDENGNFNFSTGTDFGQLIADLKEQQKAEIENILLPNQQDRLKQVARQMKMKRMGSEKAITKVMAEELGISDEQKKKIAEKSKKLQADLEKKIAELRAKAKKELLEELSQDQRDKLEELLGDEFVVKDEDSKDRFPGLQKLLNKRKSKSRDF